MSSYAAAARRRRRRTDDDDERTMTEETDNEAPPRFKKAALQEDETLPLPLPNLESDIGTIYGYGSSITKVIEANNGNDGDDEGGLEEDTYQHGVCYDDMPNARSVAYNNSYIARATGKLY